MVCLQNLYKDHVIGPNILNIMAHGFWNISTIAGVIVEGPRVALRSIDTDSRISCHKEIPFIARSMPVDLTHSTRLDGYDRCGEHAREGKCCRVDDLDTSAGNFVCGCFLGEMVCVRLLSGDDAR